LAPLRYALPMEYVFTPPNVYQFRVVVQGISPLIWRRLLLSSDVSLATLHATFRSSSPGATCIYMPSVSTARNTAARVSAVPTSRTTRVTCHLARCTCTEESISPTSTSLLITGSVTSDLQPCYPWTHDVAAPSGRADDFIRGIWLGSLPGGGGAGPGVSAAQPGSRRSSHDWSFMDI
jgi:hypothetical protein